MGTNLEAIIARLENRSPQKTKEDDSLVMPRNYDDFLKITKLVR